MKTKNYLNKTDITYELIISKGKGKATENLEKMIVQIATEMIKKFSYKVYDDRYDCYMMGVYMMLEGWKSFDELRYDNGFAYLSEICKRGISKGLAELTNKKSCIKITPKFYEYAKIKY